MCDANQDLDLVLYPGRDAGVFDIRITRLQPGAVYSGQNSEFTRIRRGRRRCRCRLMDALGFISNLLDDGNVFRNLVTYVACLLKMLGALMSTGTYMTLAQTSMAVDHSLTNMSL